MGLGRIDRHQESRVYESLKHGIGRIERRFGVRFGGDAVPDDSLDDRGGLAERSGLEIRRLFEPWRACLRADGREVRRRNAAFSIDLWNGAVIDLMLQAGPAAIEARVLELAGKARAMLCGLGAEVNADESQIVTAILPGQDARELARSLKERRILVSARHGRLRVSPHFYNDETDLETLRTALA